MGSEANTYFIASDGGCSPNPGLGGWAFAVFCSEPKQGCEALGAGGDPLCGSGHLEDTTNNIMELTGLKMGLVAFLEELRSGRIQCHDLVLYLDSQYTLNSVFTWMPAWRRKGWRKSDGKPVKNVELMQDLDRLKQELLDSGVRMRAHWVKGHSGDYANDLVDQMLTDARNGARS